MRIDGFVILHLRLLGVIGCMVWWHASAVAEVKVSPLVVPKQGKTGYQRLSVKETGLYPKGKYVGCLLYTSPSPRDQRGSRMPSSA